MNPELSRFETELLHVERMVRDSQSPAIVFPAAAAALRCLAPVDGCSVWLTGSKSSRRLIQEGRCVHDDEAMLAAIQSYVEQREATATVPAQKLPTTEQPSNEQPSNEQPSNEQPSNKQSTGEQPDVRHGPALLAMSQLVPEEAIMLEVRLAAGQEASRLLTEATAAVVDCLADLYRRVLLSDAKRQLAISNSLAGATHLLYRRKSDSDRALVLVNELRAALSVDRVSLLRRDGRRRWTLLGVSGSAAVERASDTARAIQAATKELLASKQGRRWIDVSSEPAVSRESLRTLKLHGTRYVQLLPIKGESVSGKKSTDHHALLLESFSPETPAGEAMHHISNHVQQLLTNCFRQPKLVWQKRLLRRSIIVLSIMTVLAVLLLWKRDFELEVPGHAFPQNRVRVFAPADGVVESLSVDNQSVVKAGTELLRIRDEDLELELQRTLGSLRTEETRLAALKRSRTLQAQDDRGLPTSEAASEQRIEDLRTQLQLLNAHHHRLTLTSTTNGLTLRSNLRDELLSRPVRRGQILFEIVPTNSPWELQLQIPDRLVGYVRDAMQDAQTPRVRFYSRLAPEIAVDSTLQSMDDYIQEQNQVWFCRGTVPVPEVAVEELTVGTSVTARIHCGQATTGFILFREVIEFGRELWFGWM
ncbi:MAG: biotin/lipoyl-binding protein [Planctomycetaceae bacterium]